MIELKYNKEIQDENKVLLEAKIATLKICEVKKTGKKVTFGKLIVNDESGVNQWIDFNADDINALLSKNGLNDLKVGDIIQVVGYLREKPNSWTDKKTGEIITKTKTSLVGIEKLKIVERFVKKEIELEN